MSDAKERRAGERAHAIPLHLWRAAADPQEVTGGRSPHTSAGTLGVWIGCCGVAGCGWPKTMCWTRGRKVIQTNTTRRTTAPYLMARGHSGGA
jgi:hypothetical protein